MAKANPKKGSKSRKSKRGGKKSQKRRGSSKKRKAGRGTKFDEARVSSKKHNKKIGDVKSYDRKQHVKAHQRRTNPSANPINIHVRMPKLGIAPRKSNPIGGRGKSNPIRGLMSNQGPYTAGQIKSFAIGVFGLAVGLTGAEVVDRLVATRTPKDGKHPYFGRAAAGAIALRPDGVRLGAQGALALGSLGLWYFARNMRLLKWFFGAMAVGAGTNLGRMLIMGYLLPMLAKSKDGTEKNFGNRVVPMEQAYLQDEALKFFKNWNVAGSFLQAQQQETFTPISPNAASIGIGPQPMFVLGDQPSTVAGPRFAHDGTVATCDICGGRGGHKTDCKSYCPACEDLDGYTVQDGDNLISMCGLAGIDPNYVAGVNGGKALTQFKAGEEIDVPHLFALWIDKTHDERHGKKNGNGNRPMPGMADGPPMNVPPPVESAPRAPAAPAYGPSQDAE